MLILNVGVNYRRFNSLRKNKWIFKQVKYSLLHFFINFFLTLLNRQNFKT